MSFLAENNVIRVSDTNGDVVFDTGTPMPHIAAVLTTNIIHQFPESGDTAVVLDSDIIPSFCRELDTFMERVCRRERVCRDVPRQESYEVCTGVPPNEFCYTSYRTVYVEECTYENVCTYERVTEFVYVDGYQTASGNRVSAREHSQTYDIGSVPAGTNPDFLLVLMKANRTVVGSQSDFGAFISAIPNGQKIAANGSTVLESAFIPGGAPWLSRIVSVFLDGDKVKAEFKHSNRQYTSRRATDIAEACYGFPDPYAPPDNTRSTWDVTFEVYVGKFTT